MAMATFTRDGLHDNFCFHSFLQGARSALRWGWKVWGSGTSASCVQWDKMEVCDRIIQDLCVATIPNLL